MTDDGPVLPLLGPDATRAALDAAGLPDRLQGVNLLRTALHHTGIAKVIGDAIDAIVLSGTLDARLRELAIMRVGWRLGAAYEWGNHYALARRVGVTDAEITAVREHDPAALGTVERLVVRVVDEVLDGVSVTATTLRDVRDHLADDAALLELVMIPACYRAIGTLLLTFNGPLEDGIGSWPPDGRAPATPPT